MKAKDAELIARHMAKPKPQSNWRLSDTAREILRTIAEQDRRSQAASLEIILEEEARRRNLESKILKRYAKLPDAK